MCESAVSEIIREIIRPGVPVACVISNLLVHLSMRTFEAIHIQIDANVASARVRISVTTKGVRRRRYSEATSTSTELCATWLALQNLKRHSFP